MNRVKNAIRDEYDGEDSSVEMMKRVNPSLLLSLPPLVSKAYTCSSLPTGKEQVEQQLFAAFPFLFDFMRLDSFPE